LKNELDIVDKNLEQEETHKEGLLKVKMQSLIDEIEYLKKHYQVELEAIRQENGLLRKRCKIATAQKDENNQSMEIMGESIFGQKIAQADDLISKNQWRTPDD
jgi:hypothetical protein